MKSSKVNIFQSIKQSTFYFLSTVPTASPHSLLLPCHLETTSSDETNGRLRTLVCGASVCILAICFSSPLVSILSDGTITALLVCQRHLGAIQSIACMEGMQKVHTSFTSFYLINKVFFFPRQGLTM